MPSPDVPQNPVADPIVKKDGSTFSPSPDAGQPLPRRRTEDTKTYVREWTILLVALGGWAITFCADMATYESFEDVWTPKFLGIHAGQLFTVTVSVLTAKRIR